MSQCRKIEGTSFHQTQGEGDEHIGYGVEYKKYPIFLKLSNKFIFSPIDIIILDYFFLIRKNSWPFGRIEPTIISVLELCVWIFEINKKYDL